MLFFFFNDTATTEIYTLSLHDALPICLGDDEGEALEKLVPGEPRPEDAVGHGLLGIEPRLEVPVRGQLRQSLVLLGDLPIQLGDLLLHAVEPHEEEEVHPDHGDEGDGPHDEERGRYPSP